MKLLKYFAIILGIGVVAVVGIAAYVAATFDPNQYKPQIVRVVKEKTQRNLNLQGDIKLAFFPSIGARLGKATLSERASNKEFAGVEDLRVAVKLMPLLSKQVVVDAVEVKGLRANLVRYKDGRTNFDDLAGGAPAQAAAAPKSAGTEAPLAIDIDHIAIQDGAINFRDEAKGEDYALSRINLKTGRVASGVPTGVDLSLTVHGNRPKLDLAVGLKTQLTFDLEGQVCALKDLALEAKGRAADITNLAAKVGGSVTAKLKSSEFTADKLSVAVSGASGKDQIDLKLDAPALKLTSEKASGDKVTIVATVTNPEGTTRANLVLPGIEGTMQSFRSGAITLDLDRKQADLNIKARVSSPLSGNVQARQFHLPKLTANIEASGPGLPGKKVGGELAGSASVDGAKQTLQASLSGKVDDSNVKARIGASKFAPLSVNFDVEMDRLDVDRYLPSHAGPGQKSDTGKAPTAGQTPAPGQRQPEQPIDLSALKNLRLDGKLRIGSLKVSNVKASNVRLEMKAADGRLDVSPLSANLYQGTLAGSAVVNAAATSTFAVRQKLAGVNVGPLLKDLADQDALEGRGNVAVDLTARGNTPSALKKALNGTVAVNLVDGAIKGINIAGSIRNVQARLGTLKGEQVQQSSKTEKTDFSEMNATFNIRNGVAHNSDLSLKSPLLRVGGEGNIDIGESTVDYLVKATIVGTIQGQGGRDIGNLRGVTVPIHVAGPLAAPSYKLDFSSMVTQAAKQKVEQAVQKKLEERLGGAAKDGSKGGGLQEQLKGLFGR